MIRHSVCLWKKFLSTWVAARRGCLVSSLIVRLFTAVQNWKEDHRAWTSFFLSFCLQDAWLCMGIGPCPSLWDISPQSCVSDCSLYTCTGCHPSCRTCVGPEASHCLQCWAPEDVLQPHQPVEGAVHGFCLSHCQAHFYLDVTGVCRRELRMETVLWGFKHCAEFYVSGHFVLCLLLVCFEFLCNTFGGKYTLHVICM